MLSRLAFTLALTLFAAPVRAACDGRDLVPTLPVAERAAIKSAVDATPFARGNAWRAIRGSEVVDIVGTYHFDDERHEMVMEALRPTLDVASVLLVEAGPRETDKLAADMTSRPDLLYIMEGPTLPELLPDADWRLFSDAMSQRGIPAIFAAKMQPWYATMVLSTPPCMMAELAEGDVRGLDRRIIERAEERRIPIRALEPYDTAFRLFQNLPRDLQVDMIRMSLATEDFQAEDMMATLTRAYFDEDVRLTWELGRIVAKKIPGMTAEKVDATYAAMEEALMIRRNESWLPVIEDATRRGRVFAAVGALHLSGEKGILKLLERAGFRIERRAFQ
ncbi:MAG TPA: TraB/GumN family protein [Albidovulum sp.]|uniref:TraB/GumN family protein n=1 Tax=Albidovulum sp. TaxID=1872424 RepID=UPI002C51D7F0|nr:TraB/GumN family protein [Albidovulum sp.]